ncbi:MAG: lipid-transfer protein [Rhodospirillales bacterium]|nr:lipid-transfer protein [Rhodospirillales bacterium]
MSEKTLVVGVGMTRFVKPGTSESYDALGESAVRLALADAGLGYESVQQVYVGHVYGDSTSGQAAVYRVGLTGVPIVNVNNNCSTGSTALFLARQAVSTGAVDCALALGFEQMQRGALGAIFTDRPSPLARFLDEIDRLEGPSETPMAIRLFGAAGSEYQRRYGISDEAFAMVSVKARRHARDNERALFREPLTVEEVLASPRLHGTVTRLQCSPPTCGAAAAVVCSEAFARRHGLDGGVRILAQSMSTDSEATFSGSAIEVVGRTMSATAARQVYEAAGVGPEDLDVVELHDCFTSNEVIAYEALGLTPEGTAERFILDGDNTYGGRVVTNPSGGLLAKGHPLGATGLAQCAELVWQLRGDAGTRQVPNARLGLQHNIGLGGACVVTLYGRA